MEQRQPGESRLALLIDADNVSSKYIKPIMDELSKYGTVTYKRIYGDWTSTLHSKWKDTLLDNSLTPIQQFSYTTGKNATDSAMIIDAMDILYTKSVEGFCIVSSDSDFTRLASRLRESGVLVIGMGEKKTPTPFRKACDIFTTLELLVRADREKANGGHTTPKSEIERAVVTIITDNQNNGKSTGLGEVGSRLLKQYPDFDVRSYGTNLLSKLLGEFESVDVIRDGSNVAVVLSDAGTDAAHAKAAEAGGDAEGAGAGNAAEASVDDAASEPKRTRRHRKSKIVNAEGIKTVEDDQPAQAPEPDAAPSADEAAAPAEEAAASAEAEEAPKPRSNARTRRGTRGGRRRKAKAAAAEQAAEAVETAEAAEGAAPQEGTAKPQAAQPTDAASEAPNADESAPADAPEQPKRRRGRPRRSAPVSHPAPEAENAPAKTRTRRKRIAAKTEPDVANADVASFVRDAIRAAGAAGIDVNDVSKQVRARFKSFKVRDLGYTQLKAYIADLDGIVVEKQGKTSVARLAD